MSELKNEEEEILKIDNIDSYINNLSPEEVNSKLIAFSKLCEDKMKEMQILFTTINQKEDKINKLATTTSLLKENNNTSNQSDEPKIDEVLRREHNQKIHELQKEYQDKLEKEIESLEEKYKTEMDQIMEEHNKKVKELQEAIEKMKSEIEYANENQVQYITIAEHKDKIQSILDENKDLIEKYDKDIEDIETKIKTKYPNMINNDNAFIKNNNIVYLPKFDVESIQDSKFKEELEKYLTFVKSIKENEKNGYITLLSPISTKPEEHQRNKESIIINKTENSEYESNDCDYDIGDQEDIKIELKTQTYHTSISQKK